MKTVDREAFAQALKRVRLLALDIDGTILTDDKRLTKRTASAIRGASEKGIQVVLVTGRPLSGIPQALADISGIRFAITSNGAATTDRIRKTRLRSACLDADTACAIARIPMEKGLVHSVFLDDYGFCEPAFFEMQRALYASTPIEQYFRASRRETDSIERTIRASRAGVENIWMIAKDRAQRDEIDRRWCRSLLSEDEMSIPPRTFHRWRIAIEELFQISIAYDKWRGYYIEDRDDIKHEPMR
ncbi:MAG: HAD hydrolase family protein, partial [Oscillospiraceae bacterium]|nr:HAD hydrolase family protein [Oscillospiraceae bacterium]